MATKINFAKNVGIFSDSDQNCVDDPTSHCGNKRTLQAVEAENDHPMFSKKQKEIVDNSTASGGIVTNDIATMGKLKIVKERTKTAVWNDSETALYLELVPKYTTEQGVIDWTEIAKHLPRRTSTMCRHRMNSIVRQQRRKEELSKCETNSDPKEKLEDNVHEAPVKSKIGTGNKNRNSDNGWTQDEIAHLIEHIPTYQKIVHGVLKIDWNSISNCGIFGTRSKASIKKKYFSLKLKDALPSEAILPYEDSNFWSEEEDKQLLEAFKAHTIQLNGKDFTNWSDIVLALGDTRTSDGIRARYRRIMRDMV